MRPNLLAIAAIAALLPLAAAAQPLVQSQEGIALENQILQLQNQVQQLQNGGASGGGSSLGGNSSPPPPSSSDSAAPPSSILTSLLTQVQQMQAQIQTLNGEVDTLQNQVNTQHDATEKEIGDLKFQMTNGAPGAPGAAPPPSAPPTTLTPPPGATPGPAAMAAPPGPQSPKAALHAAQQAIIHGDYATAQTEAQAVIATSKSTPQGYQAQYILAQALLGQNQPQKSAIAFDDVYNRNRTGAYAPGSLLGLANSLTAIHQEAAACDTLQSLNSQFPNPPKYLVTAIGDAGKRAHCS